MESFTIGFTQTSDAEFFHKLKQAGVRWLLDVRLNNTSQLAAYAKRDDLKFILREICHVEYEHELQAPTQEMPDAYKKQTGNWQVYEQQFLSLMDQRQIERHLDRDRLESKPTVLLCSEYAADHCHRRLVIEYLQQKWPGFVAVHL